jgi:hypothetical protein
MRNKPWLKPKYGKKDATWDSKRLTESSRFATLSLRLELEALAAPDDPCSDQDKLVFAIFNMMLCWAVVENTLMCRGIFDMLTCVLVM